MVFKSRLNLKYQPRIKVDQELRWQNLESAIFEWRINH